MLTVTPAPTPVFTSADGVNAPESAQDGWVVQSANGSNQQLVTNPAS